MDEIQECPEAITSLKFWTQDQRYDVIASGSMLGIDYNRPSSYPVGYVDHIRMYGLDFEEFLWAFGVNREMLSSLKNMFLERKIIPDAIHIQMMKYFRMYVALGGMPEVVDQYIASQDFRKVDTIQKQLLQGYLYDIAHYAVADEKVKAEKCFLSLGRQLLDKENHKFQYKEIESGARAQKYYSSIEWLIRADIIENTLSGNTKAASLNRIMKNNPEMDMAYKLIDGNIGEDENGIVSIPLYMAMFL